MTRGEQFPMSLWLMRSLAAGTLLFENCQEPGEYMEIVSNVLTKQPLVKPRYTPGRFGPVIMLRNLEVLVFRLMHQLRSDALFCWPMLATGHQASVPESTYLTMSWCVKWILK